MNIFYVVLKITLYHEDAARIIIMKNGATLGRTVHCILRVLKGYLSPLLQGHRKVQNIFPYKEESLDESSLMIDMHLRVSRAPLSDLHGHSPFLQPLQPFLSPKHSGLLGVQMHFHNWALDTSLSGCKLLGRPSYQRLNQSPWRYHLVFNIFMVCFIMFCYVIIIGR